MKIEKLYIVIYPTKESVLEDICFEVDTKGLRFQFLGGLSHIDIEGLYTNQHEAEQSAKSLLSA